MYKTTENVILIGAGHIGAMSDFYSDEINTYAKFFSEKSNSNICVIEPNQNIASLISNKYGFKTLPNYQKLLLSKFSLAIIASPSHLHFQQLVDCIGAGVPKIICEKPIFTKLNQFEPLRQIIKSHSDLKLFANYPRVFLSEFARVKDFIRYNLEKTPKKIQIRYQRGFLNNCSHAFNLISFILNKELDIPDFKKTQIVYDHFEDDPTISGSGYWDDTLVEISGVPYINYSNFEIDMYFANFRLLIDNCGRRISIYQAMQKVQHVQPIPDRTFLMSIPKYSDVLPVLNHAYSDIDTTESREFFDKVLSSTYSLIKIMES